MIKVNKLIPEGAKGKFGIMKFDISFDSASHLPVDTYTLNMTTFIIANGSIAKNIQTGIYYEYNNGKWNKTTNIHSDADNNTITTSGIHTIANNDIGVSRINIDIPSAPEPTLIDKTITENGTYNATDDEADGYSKVVVDVDDSAHFSMLKVSVPYLYSGDVALNIVKMYTSTDGIYNVSTDSQAQKAVLCNPARQIKIGNMLPSTAVIFTPDDNFDGFYINGSKIVPTGDTIGAKNLNDTYYGFTTSGSGGVIVGINIKKATSYQFPFTFSII